MKGPIPTVGQVWKVEDDNLVTIVAMQSECFEEAKKATPIKDKQGSDGAVHVAYSDGMTGAFYADTGIGLSSYRLVWCPFGQHEGAKDND